MLTHLLEADWGGEWLDWELPTVQPSPRLSPPQGNATLPGAEQGQVPLGQSLISTCEPGTISSHTSRRPTPQRVTPAPLWPRRCLPQRDTHFHMCELRCLSSMELRAEQNRSSRRLNT